MVKEQFNCFVLLSSCCFENKLSSENRHSDMRDWNLKSETSSRSWFGTMVWQILLSNHCFGKKLAPALFRANKILGKCQKRKFLSIVWSGHWSNRHFHSTLACVNSCVGSRYKSFMERKASSQTASKQCSSPSVEVSCVEVRTDPEHQPSCCGS